MKKVFDPREGDMVDNVEITRIWTTGKVDLANGKSVHIRQLDFVAAGDFTVAREYNPHIHW